MRVNKHDLQSILSAINEAIAVVDAELNVVFHNRGAQCAFSPSPCISLEGARLAVGCPVDRAALRAAVIAAIEHDRSSAIKLHDTKGGTCAFCRVLPLPNADPQKYANRERLALIVCRSSSVAHEQIRAVCELYRLSQAECRVAEQLARGASPQAIASGIGCSIHTVRAHLKQIFYKTSTARQSEFIALVRTAVP